MGEEAPAALTMWVVFTGSISLPNKPVIRPSPKKRLNHQPQVPLRSALQVISSAECSSRLKRKFKNDFHSRPVGEPKSHLYRIHINQPSFDLAPIQRVSWLLPAISPQKHIISNDFHTIRNLSKKAREEQIYPKNLIVYILKK